MKIGGGGGVNLCPAALREAAAGHHSDLDVAGEVEEAGGDDEEGEQAPLQEDPARRRMLLLHGSARLGAVWPSGGRTDGQSGGRRAFLLTHLERSVGRLDGREVPKQLCAHAH